MKRLTKFLHDLLIIFICIIVFAYALLGLFVWNVCKSEWMLMSIDRFVIWIDKVLKLNEVKSE